MSADNWTTCPQCGADKKVREDWELGISDGKFTLLYRAYCTSCEWSYRKEIAEEPVDIVNRKRK